MKTNQIHIKNMVCDRCIKSVHDILVSLDYPAEDVVLGVATFEKPIDIDTDILQAALKNEGFVLISNETSKVINRVKSLIIQQIHHEDPAQRNINLSTLLEKEIGKNYSYLSSLFSKTEGRTIEKYAIQQRIERAKELLIYDDKTISEIAWSLGYSSSQYLSNQFKAETGMTPSQFRKTIRQHRTPLDEV